MTAATRDFEVLGPLDVGLTTADLLHARNDPAIRVGANTVWLTGRMPSGAATMQLSRDPSHHRADAQRWTASAWGPGAEQILARAPGVLGADDHPEGFEPEGPPWLVQAHRRFGAGLRVPASGLVLEAGVAAALEQKVVGKQARAAWVALLREHGEPAPGPAPSRMRVLPEPRVLGGIDDLWWRQHGVDRSRAGTIRALAGYAGRVTQCADLELPQAQARLAALPGIGPWSVAEISFRALGDADAVSVGDYHLANEVGYALTAARQTTDEQMLRLLQPWAGHRYRVIRLLRLAGPTRPRRGPRMALPAHQRFWGSR